MLYKILNNFKNTYKSWSNLIKLNNLTLNMKRIIFYVEDASDWAHLNPIINALKIRKQSVVRITSDPRDKLLEHQNVFYIGFGSARTFLFRTLVAKSLVMTLPDLGSFHLKRSIHPVHYFYVFHSIVSTHRIYREHAFNAYDTILCVGEHHIKEIKKTEKVYGLSKKNIEKHGYGRLDTLISEKNKKKFLDKKIKTLPRILIAPSWGESSIVNQLLNKLIEILIMANFNVTVRLHPMTERHYPKLSNNLKKKYEGSGNFFFDSDIASVDSLLESDIIISEWSGAAIEYAFATERPVIFIDNKIKINNLNWKKIDLPCLEETIRNEIGIIVSKKELESIPSIINELLSNNINIWSNKIRNIRNNTVFNIGTSGKIGAEIIFKTLGLKK